jgi:hypothetical protein
MLILCMFEQNKLVCSIFQISVIYAWRVITEAKAGVSDTRPARCVFAASDIIKITQFIVETTVFVV